jgi:DNA-binding CsgD family transcriptional regulator
MYKERKRDVLGLTTIKKAYQAITKELTKLGANLRDLKRQNKKTYFQKVSFNTIFIILAFCTIIIFTELRIFNVINEEAFVFLGQGNNALDAQLVYFIVYYLTAGVFLFFVKPRLVNRSLFIGIPLLIIGFVTLNYTDQKIFSFISIILMGLGAGALLVSSLLFFVFILNTSERLLATIIIVLLSVFYFGVSELVGLISINAKEFIVPLVFLGLLYLSIFFNKRYDFTDIEFKDEEIPIASKALVICMVFLISLCSFLLNFYVKEFSTIGSIIDISRFVGYLLCVAFVISIFTFSRNALTITIIVYLFSVFFTFQFGILYLLFEGSKTYAILSAIISGFTLSLGLVNILMLVGKVFEDRSNIKEFRSTMLISIVVAGIIGAIIERVLNKVSLEVSTTLWLFFSIGIIFTFIIIHSSFNRSKSNIKIGARVVNQTEETLDWETLLNPKEKEIFALLLEGLTMRQIAGELKMKYDTVNYYYKNIYRKLNINSRVELIVRYSKQ